MNKETFNQLVSNAAQVDPKHKEELSKLIESFPFSSNLRLLHLSALYNDTDLHFDKELKITSSYVSDRRVLRKLLSTETAKEEYIIPENNTPLQVVKPEVEEPVTSETLELKTEPVVEEAETITLPQETEIKEEITELEIASEAIEPETIETTETEAVEAKEEVEEKEENTPLIPELEGQIIASAVNASLTLEVDDIIEEAQEELIQNPPQEIVEEKDQKKSFLAWIGANTDASEELSEQSEKEKERELFRKRAESLINQFIVNQPRIDAKKEFYSPGNMAKKSLEDEGEIVSETLANVYAKQGNIQKAINTYQQLILKYPEKKSYFATLIENLKS